jgi:3-oxoacyl-[acyl-carrier protein] reductase
MNLEDSRILLTGGSLGIGKAAAKLFVESGAKVGITGRDQDRLSKAAKETGAFPIVADVSKVEDIDRTYDTFKREFGGLDCLINNAGIGRWVKSDEPTLEDFGDVFGVNVYGAALMAARAIPVFRKQGRGNIVNIGSTAALKGFEGGTVYAATKFALRGMTQCWQAELRKDNIRVFLINPSEVATAIGSADRVEREASPNKLSSMEIAHAIKSVLEMDDRGFIPELSVWATNPW